MDEIKALQAISIIIENTIAHNDQVEVLAKCKSVLGAESSPEISLAAAIREWILDQSVTPGVTFSVTQADQELRLVTKNEKLNRRVIFHRLVKEGLIEPWGKKAGMYRVVSREIEEIDFVNLPEESQALDLHFPLELHKRFEIPPGSIIIVSGESNAGKTAFILNIARLNMGRMRVTYFGSSAESNARTLNKRIRAFGDPLEEWAPMRAIRRSGDFADVIDADGLNLIDYLELTGAQGKEFFLVGEEISRIHEALGDGVAVIGLQHKPGADYAVGGHMTVHKATVALSLHAGKIDKGIPHTLRFQKLKYPKCDNAYYAVKFRLGGGCHFVGVE
ncbi:hypothetical protein [Desulfoferula mesophila]